MKKQTKQSQAANEHLIIPPILTRIDSVRQKLAGTDRTDHLRELDLWEQRAKKDLITLSLRGHEGIDMIIQQAKESIAQCQAKLRTERPDPKADVNKYFLDHQFLFQQIDLWGWFLGLFSEAQIDLDAIEIELAQQEEGEEDDM